MAGSRREASLALFERHARESEAMLSIQYSLGVIEREHRDKVEMCILALSHPEEWLLFI